jgi:hypothetical protein
MHTFAFAIDEWEWDSLHTGFLKARKGIHEGDIIEAQLGIWPDVILHYWNANTERDKLGFLGTEFRNSPPKQLLKRLNDNSNLYLISATVKQIERRAWKAQPEKETINSLLDCGVPIVLNEDVKKGETSRYVSKAGDLVVAICLLFGSIIDSPSFIQTPISCKVKHVTNLNTIPQAKLFEVELQPSEVTPLTRVSYDPPLTVRAPTTTNSVFC